MLRLALVLIACLIVSGANAKGKPDNPGETETERIVFTGDLVGDGLVEGCCPNAGPFPQYTMTFDVPDVPALNGPYDGELFINGYRIGQDRGYIVQFSNDHTLDDHVAIEIRGGEVSVDKKTKEVTVVFKEAECRDQHDPKELITYVTFTLVRTPN